MSREDWKRMVKISANSFAQVLRSLPGMPSGPGALCSLTCRRSLRMPFFDILILVSSVSVSLGGGVKLVFSCGFEKTFEN